MKVVIPVGGLYKNGGCKQLADVANGLVDRGHQVEVLIIRGQPVHFPLRAKVTYVPRLAKEYVPYGDIVLVTFYTTFKAAWKAWPDQCVRFCQAFEPDYVKHKEFAASTYRPEIPVISISSYLDDQIFKLTGRRGHVVLCGTNPKNFHPPGIKASKEKKPHKVIMYIARDPKAGYHLKRYPDFVKAMKIFHEHYKRPYLVYMVCTERPLPLPGIPHKIFRPKSEKGMAELYQKADVFVSTSYTEGFGLPVLEAMHCMTPVVTTNSGGILDFCQHMKTAIVTPPLKPKAIAAGMLRMLSDRKLAHNLKIRAYQATKHLTLDRFVSGVVECLEKIHRIKTTRPVIHIHKT